MPTREAACATVMVLGTTQAVQLASGPVWVVSLFWKITALSQGSRMLGVPEAITTGCFSDGLSARKSASLTSARRAITATSMSRSSVTVSKNGWLPIKGSVAL